MHSVHSTSAGRLVGGPQRSLGAVVGDILTGVTALAKAEVRLAVAEVVSEATDRSRAAAHASGIVAVGALLAVFALGGLLVAAGAALALVMAAWIAALIVAVVVGVVAAVAFSVGMTHLRQSLQPADKTSTHHDKAPTHHERTSSHHDNTALSIRAKETG